MPRILVFALAAILGCSESDQAAPAPPGDPPGSAPTAPSATATGAPAPQEPNEQGAGNVVLESPRKGTPIASNPFVVSGRARTFENHVGIRLQDEKGYVTDETWTTALGELGTFNPFSEEVFITSDPGEQMRVVVFETSAKDGSIRSRDSAEVRVTVPRRPLRLYFPHRQSGGEDCTRVQAVVRNVPVSVSAARLTVEALLRGPTHAERVAGFTQPFPRSARVRSINLRDGVLTVDFDATMGSVGGSCRVQSIRASLERTLLELENVDRVVITAMGSEATALQP